MRTKNTPMEKNILILVVIWWAILLYLIVVFLSLRGKVKKMNEIESAIIELYYNKINKLPALIEIMKQHTTHGDICTEMVRLHRATVITRVDSVYDLLELNRRIQREFNFLMKVSAKIKDLHRNGNFLYIRDFLTFYEININKLIVEYNREVARYNTIRSLKNYSILGIFLPISRKMMI